MGKLIFRVKAEADQKLQIKNIRETATSLWPATRILIDRVGKTANVIVSAVPDSFHDASVVLAFGQGAIHREWDEKPKEGFSAAVPVAEHNASNDE
jgi:hypothetical protein